jgi:hypothetical protein
LIQINGLVFSTFFLIATAGRAHLAAIERLGRADRAAAIDRKRMTPGKSKVFKSTLFLAARQ